MAALLGQEHLGLALWHRRHRATGTAFKGMGFTSPKMTADVGTAIMFVEVAYDYKPFFLGSILSPKLIRKEAALYVRDDRDLTQIYDPVPKVTAKSTC